MSDKQRVKELEHKLAMKNNELAAVIEDGQAEEDKLNDEIARLESENKKLKAEKNELDDEIAETKQTMHDETEARNKVDNEAAEKSRKLIEMYKEAKAKESQYLEELNEKDENCENAADNVKQAHEQLEEEQREKALKEAQIQALIYENEEYESTVQSMRQQSGEYKNEVEDLKQQLSKKENCKGGGTVEVETAESVLTFGETQKRIQSDVDDIERTLGLARRLEEGAQDEGWEVDDRIRQLQQASEMLYFADERTGFMPTKSVAELKRQYGRAIDGEVISPLQKEFERTSKRINSKIETLRGQMRKSTAIMM